MDGGDSGRGWPGSDSVLEFSFRNRQSKPVIVIVEPWAEEFDVPDGSDLSIAISHTNIGALETEITQQYFIVWAWSGCRAKVSVDGIEQIRPSLGIPVP
jgi:hypothetical protein